MAWRDVLVRYKQTVIGVAWSVLRPLLTMVVFTIIFGRIAKLPSSGVPYPILVYAAMLPWQLFANSMSESSNSLITNSNLITKIYFPRLIVPASSVITSLVDFGISFVILIILMLWYQFIPSVRMLTIPVFLTYAIVASLGIGFWLSALNVKYRDFRHVIPFIVQFGLYISPVGFSSSIIPANLRLIYSLNPMVGVIDGFRWAILGENIQIYIPGFILSLVFTITIFFSGLWYFRRTERTFADII